MKILKQNTIIVSIMKIIQTFPYLSTKFSLTTASIGKYMRHNIIKEVWIMSHNIIPLE